MNPGPNVEDLLRELAPQVLGAASRRFGDFAAAEDAVQEALLAAAMHWPQAGLPDNPRGWLIQVAVRQMTDQIRSEQARRRREDVAAMREPPTAGVTDRGDTLIPLFMCCHPALTPGSAIALTLRAVGGLTTAEIANAFLVPEATMAQRISRAKQRVKASGVPFRMPNSDEWAQRLRSVLARTVFGLQRGLRQKHWARSAPQRAVRRGDPASQPSMTMRRVPRTPIGRRSSGCMA